jgi:F0F1-type ATP synthase membrane subunit b/b'
MEIPRPRAPLAASWRALVAGALLLWSPAAWAGDDVTIDVDKTLVVQLALIVALWALLNKLVFQPYLQVQSLRGAKTAQAREEAAALAERAAVLEQTHRRRWAGARDEATTVRGVLRGEGATAREDRLAAARAQARETLDDARVTIEAQFTAAHAELHVRSAEVAQAVVERLLGRGV